MTIPTKKAGNFELPVLGIGTWEMGGRFSRNYFHNDSGDVKAIKRAIELGVTHIDTAEIYANGRAEEITGEAIKNFDREKLFITSKVEEPHFQYDDLIKAAKLSLKRLGVKRLDLYLLHTPAEPSLIKEAMRATDYLRENEIVRHIGVSNFLVPEMEVAISNTKYGIVTNQIHVSMSARGYFDNGVYEFCRQNNIMVTAYRPLDHGTLTEETNELMSEMVKKYNRPPAQIALRWIMQQPNTVTIFKAAQISHLEEDLGALEWELEKADMEKMNKDYPRGRTLMYRYHENSHTNKPLP